MNVSAAAKVARRWSGERAEWWGVIALVACGAMHSSASAQSTSPAARGAAPTAPVQAQSPAATPGAQDAEQPWVELFNGRSFDGWEGNLEWFRVEDGCIVGGHLDRPVPRNEFLTTRERYRNFELKLQVKVLGEGVNAGIQLRTERIPNHHEVSGYQADVGSGYWGKLYDESRRNKILAGTIDAEKEGLVRVNDWNDYRILCEGDRIQLWLNGRQTVDYREEDPQIAREGIIAVQIHAGPASEAWYRHLQIRRLAD